MARHRSASFWRTAVLWLCLLLAIMTVACGNSTRSPVEASGGAGSSGAGDGGGGGDIDVVTRGGAQASGGSQPAATLLSLELEPAEVTVLVDATLSLEIWAVYSNGEREDVRSRAKLSSSEPELVSLSGYRLTARSPGVATVTATLFGVSGTAKITVLAKTITAIAVTAAEPGLSPGEALQAHAEALMDDGSRRDVTSLATWSSSNPQVARLTTSGFLIAMGRGTATLTATVGGVSGSVEQRVTGETLTAYTITGPHVLRMGGQSTVQLRAHYGSRVVTERDVIWQTTDASVVSVTPNGVVAGVATGTVTISAVLGSDVAATLDIVVTDAVLTSLELEGARVFGFCAPPKLRLVGTFSDGSRYDVGALLDGTATDSVVEVVRSGSEISLLPKALGDVEIELGVEDVWAIAQLSIVLGSPTRIVMDSLQPFPVAASTGLSARAYCTDDGPSISVSKIVTWSLDDPTVAAFASAGGWPELVGLRPGATAVHATYPGFAIEPRSVSVWAGTPTELLIQPEEPYFGDDSGPLAMRSVARYPDQFLYDVTHSCVWSTSNSLAATISNANGTKGFVTPLRAGTGSISAKLGALSASTTFTVQ